MATFGTINVHSVAVYVPTNAHNEWMYLSRMYLIGMVETVVENMLSMGTVNIVNVVTPRMNDL